MSAINSTNEGTASSFQDTEQSRRRENFINRDLEFSEDVDYCQQILDAHSGSDFDLEFRRFLDKNCQFLLELCRRPIDPMPASIPLTPRSNLELQLVLVDRALEAQSKASFPTKMESKMEDKVKGEVLGTLSELTKSIKSVIEVVANGSTKTMSNGSNRLEQQSKKRKGAPK